MPDVTVDFEHWPYPYWVAHRGAGKLAPENTMAAFQLGAHHGYRMFECDAKLAADDELFLLHDDDLDRTTSGSGLAGALRWPALQSLDAGSWHSPAYAAEPLASLDQLCAWARANGYLLDVEIKPSPGADEATGQAVAAFCAERWAATEIPPLLTSFKPHALRAAQQTAPRLPRGLLLDRLWDGWFDAAQQLACVALMLKHTLADAALVQRAHAARLRVGVYTPNAADDIARVRAAGVDMIITDAVDVHSPEHPPGPGPLK